ncbi:PREDICTED: dihydrolipoyllysine-residue succinyltransferase component of 2-oxoglutarate dehydrogenase complex, mitochondrial-like [Diuraphis noxia]|uniref:dihydrolipoyllysine-residue succinyltransferase component of 2-oxoglutarate dehydrogenase complex, mitochondrial-like n=1 Tax=Diuraphis noxia TaxID=143948 RepID=UPI0007636F9F|nr:PREDICTED: dihydrolipoyllysine-residue succinyltransferase component of 2-oxoglutarate dehydrogenase complex, mitochondrial-like [Diuraphis noxia]
MNYADIEKTIAALGEKAKIGAINVEDMDGGTLTVNNVGVFKSLMETPIINPPQSVILGMHGIFERPLALKGQDTIYYCSILLLIIINVIFLFYSLGCHTTNDISR